MGCALKAGLFGSSLRRTAYILMEVHVLFSAYSLFKTLVFGDQGGPIDKLTNGVSVVEWAVVAQILKSLTIETYIFMLAVWSIAKQQSTITVLAMTLVVFLLKSLYLIYVVTVINFGVHYSLNISHMESGTCVEIGYPSEISMMNLESILDLFFHCYSAVVIHSYRVEIKETLANNILRTHSTFRYKRENDVATEAPPAYENLETVAPLRGSNETTSSV